AGVRVRRSARRILSARPVRRPLEQLPQFVGAGRIELEQRAVLEDHVHDLARGPEGDAGGADVASQIVGAGAIELQERPGRRGHPPHLRPGGAARARGGGAAVGEGGGARGVALGQRARGWDPPPHRPPPPRHDGARATAASATAPATRTGPPAAPNCPREPFWKVTSRTSPPGPKATLAARTPPPRVCVPVESNCVSTPVELTSSSTSPDGPNAALTEGGRAVVAGGGVGEEASATPGENSD